MQCLTMSHISLSLSLLWSKHVFNPTKRAFTRPSHSKVKMKQWEVCRDLSLSWTTVELRPLSLIRPIALVRQTCQLIFIVKIDAAQYFFRITLGHLGDYNLTAPENSFSYFKISHFVAVVVGFARKTLCH